SRHMQRSKNVARFGPFEDLVHVIGHAPEQLCEIDGVTHQRTGLDVVGVRTHRRQALLLSELGDHTRKGSLITTELDKPFVVITRNGSSWPSGNCLLSISNLGSRNPTATVCHVLPRSVLNWTEKVWPSSNLSRASRMPASFPSGTTRCTPRTAGGAPPTRAV